jgi:hypothetical protein
VGVVAAAAQALHIMDLLAITYIIIALASRLILSLFFVSKKMKRIITKREQNIESKAALGKERWITKFSE